jgi:hypothetical protein
MTLYAQGTSVSEEKSRAEIEVMLRRYGASSYASGWEDSRALIVFEAKGRRVRFVLPIPSRAERRFTHRANSSRPRSKDEAARTWEQECRQRWRALALVIKAKLEAVESGITSFEAEFLAHIILPSGDTVGEWAGPQLVQIYGSGQMPPMLTAGSR